jgi:DNA-binding GntR family transcriptional regulator
LSSSSSLDSAWPAAKTPLQRLSAVEELAQALRALILDGKVRSGVQLRETEVATTFEVARNTVRSALQTLVHEGLLEHERHRGVFVRQLAAEDVADIFLLRAALESEAALRICSEQLDPTPLLESVSTIESMSNAPWRELMLADLAVHSSLVRCVRSPRLNQAFSSVMSQMQLLAAQPLDRPRNEDVAHQHRVIAEAVTSGDVAAAVGEVRAHLELARQRMLRGLKQQEPESAVGTGLIAPSSGASNSRGPARDGAPTVE